MVGQDEVERTLAWFGELRRCDTGQAGGKGANLGELTSAGLPVPPGFVVTAAGYLAAMEEGGVRDELGAVFAEACRRVDEPAALAEASERLRALVRKAHVPDRVAEEILDAYHRLGAGAAVAVRSSATSEDTAGTSFARHARDVRQRGGRRAWVARGTRSSASTGATWRASSCRRRRPSAGC